MAGGREEGRTLVREEGGRVVTWQQIYICVLCTCVMSDGSQDLEILNDGE